MKKEKMINAQLKEKLLKINDYLEKDLKTKISSETKRSHDFKSDKFCMFVGRTRGEGQTADIVIKEENGMARFFVNVHTQASPNVQRRLKNRHHASCQ